MDPWQGPHKLPLPIQRSLFLALCGGVLAWAISCVHGIVLGFTIQEYDAAAFTIFGAATTNDDALKLEISAPLTTYSQVAMMLHVIQLGIQICTLSLPMIVLAGTVRREHVMGGSFFVRLLTATGLIAAALRLSSLSNEASALLDTCVQTQTHTSVKAGLGSIDAVAAATTVCKTSLAWVKPLNMIALIVDVGGMLFFCWSVLTYERKLIAERYPSQPRGFLSWVGSSSRRGGQGGAYAPLPIAADDDEEKRN
ncbi:unnamed protein product [Tilletia controversa]|nr:unnamed protein product [Tilletia controversa]CAD6925572.1 unnamed protein product [Tilletia controversa]